MIRWPLIRSDFYPVPQYLACPNGRGVDDPTHQPADQWGVVYGEYRPVSVAYLPVDCVCGFHVTAENAKRMDAY